MNPEGPNLKQTQRSETAQALVQEQKGVQFASVEEMLRHDANQNPPPGRLAEKLSDTMAREPRVEKPWWRRIFK